MQSGWFLHCGSQVNHIPERYQDLSPIGAGAFGSVSVVGLLGPCGFVFTQPLLAAGRNDMKRKIKAAVKKLARP